MKVPAAAMASPRPAVRPARPALAAAKPSPAGRVAPSASHSAARPSRWSASRSRRWTAAGALVLAVSVAGVFTWRSFDKHTDPSDLAKDQLATSPKQAVAPGQPAGPKGELAANDPRRSYFGVELGTGSIAYVVDDDPAMKPYIESLAKVTNLVNAADSGERHGVIVRPSGRRPSALLGFAEAADSKSDIETTLSTTLPKNRQDLTYAYGIAVGRSPDAIFLVLARPLAPDEINRLAQAAEQAGTVTHLIAVGPAAKQDLSMITSAGGGQFVPLSDQQFKGQVQAYGDSEDR